MYEKEDTASAAQLSYDELTGRLPLELDGVKHRAVDALQRRRCCCGRRLIQRQAITEACEDLRAVGVRLRKAVARLVAAKMLFDDDEEMKENEDDE